MKKEYISPKAEKLVFDYEENIVAASGDVNVKDGKTGPSSNSCYTHNTSDVYGNGCQGIPKV